MRVLIADKLEAEAVAAIRKIPGVAEVRTEPDASPETMASLVSASQPTVLIVRSTKVPAAAIQAGGALRVIVRAGAGYDNIDVAAASARGVSVCNCPGMNAVAVAEIAMGHLIALDRRMVEQTTELRAGRWNKGEFAKARGLKGLRLLVVGAGAIGLEVVKRAQAFGMRVAVQSRHFDEAQGRALGVEIVGTGREALLAALPGFDAVSMHVPATDETKGMCDAAFFAAMKPGAYFINTSRGDVVDEAALVEAARAKGLRVGVDVYRNQPSAKSGDWITPLASIPGASLTHHCGASTDQAQRAVGEEVVRIVLRFVSTGEALHCVNAAALGAPAAR